MPPRVVKVAVVGSGLAGLTTAYLLSKIRARTDVEFTVGDVEFEVHLFEKATSLGMDSNSVSVPLPGFSREYRIDVPMRAFQGGYYPQLIALYKHLGVSFRPADFSYSFSYLPSLPSLKHAASALSLSPTMIYNGASGRAGASIPTALRQTSFSLHPARLFAHLHFLTSFGLSLLLLLYNFLHLQLLSIPRFRSKDTSELSWEAWVHRATPRGPLACWLGFDTRWTRFAEDVCVPLFSAVCTAAREDVLAHPAEEFLDFIYLTFLTHHYVVSNGVRDVVARLTAYIPSSNIHLGAPTTAILPDTTAPAHAARVNVVCSPAPGAEPTVHTGFDHVVFATQANHAAPLVERFSRALAQENEKKKVREWIPGVEEAACLAACLTKFEYRRTIVVNHTDASFLPADPRDVRDLNLVTVAPPHAPPPRKEKAEAKALTVPQTYTMATHRLGATPVMQTTNPLVPPRAGSVLSVARLERAVLTRAGKAAVRELAAHEDGRLGFLQGAARRDEGSFVAGLWVVGAYAHGGIPLLEGCAVSARGVVERGIVPCEGGRVHGAPW